MTAPLPTRAHHPGCPANKIARTLVFTSLLLVAGMAEAAHEIAISREQMQRIGITLVPVEKAESYVTDFLPARVTIPPQQARVVSAPRGGLVTVLTAAESDEVQAGQTLAHIESPGLVGLQRELLQAITQLRLAQAEQDRNEQLRKTNAVSERVYLESRSGLDEAAALVDARLREDFPGAGLHYWVTPLIEAGPIP